MDANEKYRPDEFTRLMTFGWNVGYRKTHWADKAFQIGEAGKYGQKLYDMIQDVPLG